MTDRPLTVTGLLMIAALLPSLAGIWLDPRLITGVPAWLKPAKFAISIAIYAFTLVWVFTFLPDWPRTRRIVGWTTAATLVLELVIIDTQAWRGTTSHFNTGTPLDGALFSIMGAAIVVQTLAAIALATALWRQRFADRAMGWALTLGMTITIVGASTGGMMLSPSASQLATARATRLMPITGSHTVGGPDGGPGIPGTGWSREHGDIRIPHFIGLHGVQALALFVLLMPRRVSESGRVRLTIAAAASYVALFVVLLVQALRAESLVAPSPFTAAMLGAWAMGTAIAFWLAGARRAAAAPMSAIVLG